MVIQMGVKPKISIKSQKCPTPFACKMCLQICPGGVFIVTPNPMKIKKYKPLDENEPKTYFLAPAVIGGCTGCMECVKICPNDAIKVEVQIVDEMAVAEQGA